MNAPQESHDQPDTSENVKEHEKKDASKAVATLKKKPALGIVLASGLGLVAASVIGVGEVAIAMAAGYAAYRALAA